MVIFIVWVVFILLERKTVESHKEVCENKDSVFSRNWNIKVQVFLKI